MWIDLGCERQYDLLLTFQTTENIFIPNIYVIMEPMSFHVFLIYVRVDCKIRETLDAKMRL